MSDLIAFLLFLSVGQAITIALLAVKGGQLNQAHERQRIRAEEAEAWQDEYQRERDVLAGELARLQEQYRTLQALYTLRTREVLAANYRHIAANVARQRGGWQ